MSRSDHCPFSRLNADSGRNQAIGARVPCSGRARNSFNDVERESPQLARPGDTPFPAADLLFANSRGFPLPSARTIPLRLPPDPRPVPDAPALHRDRSGDERPTVLVAVTEPFVAAGIHFVLEQDGFDVSAGVSSADEAVAAALATEPRICLLDQELDGDVVEATRRISALPRTPAGILSGSPERPAGPAALQAGAARYPAQTAQAPAPA